MLYQDQTEYVAFDDIVELIRGDKVLDELFYDKLAELPLRAAQQIVYCKFCKNKRKSDQEGQYFCGVLNRYVFADFFCGHGARAQVQPNDENQKGGAASIDN